MHGLRLLQCQDPLSCTFGSDDDGGRWVSSCHSREDGSVHNEEVVRSVHLGVEVDNSSAVVDTAVIRAKLSRAHPVVGATVGGRHDHLRIFVSIVSAAT